MVTYNKNKVAIVDAEDYSESTINKALDNLCSMLGLNSQNPFNEIIKPGMKVFIKPNWVASCWRKSCNHTDTIYSVITHPAVIEAIADRVALALDGHGEIIIGDNPSIDANFDELLSLTGIKKLETKYNIPCKILDLRPLICNDLKYYGKLNHMISQMGDPNGETVINLKSESLLYGIDPTLFREVFDERGDTINSHTGEKQLYSYSKSLYDADVFISIPKLKTHQKVGVTLNLKGLVGSIARKNQLVHWKIGSPETGGDEYPSLEKLNSAKMEKVTHRGAWPGNDTIWRMVVDLYKGMLFRDRIYISIIDGIIGGESQGPFCPTANHSKKLLLGFNLLATDIVATRLMGINPYKIKYLKYFLDQDNITNDLNVIINNHLVPGFFSSKNPYLDFKVMESWSEIKNLEEPPKTKL